MHTKQKIIVLGGYGTVGSVVVDDLLQSGYDTTIGGRDTDKMKNIIESKGNPLLSFVTIDLADSECMAGIFRHYDIVVSCLDYQFNNQIISICATTGVHYVDLGDSYSGILQSHTYNAKFIDNKNIACLGAGSAPGIVNVMVAYLASQMEHVEKLVISFADVLYKKVDNMLPFNFITVTEEILDDALIYRDGKHSFIPGMSESIEIDFGDEYGTLQCYMTNHDEQYSLPLYLKDKGLQEAYFVMKHDDTFLDLVPRLKKFGFLDTTPIKYHGMDINPRDFAAEVMKKWLPRNFKSDDKEVLYAKLDDRTITVVNRSVDGVPAGIMNTGIGASLITQYILEHEDTIPHGTLHPESFVDPEWMVTELKKRSFEIYIDNKPI